MIRIANSHLSSEEKLINHPLDYCIQGACDVITKNHKYVFWTCKISRRDTTHHLNYKIED